MKRIIVVIAAVCIVSCGNSNEGSAEKTEQDLPFIGKRTFETRPAVSGTGTPHRYIEILKNGDVYFSFEQENQADETVMEERFYAGKFKKHLKCFFAKLDNETTYYDVSKSRIYEVDENNERVTSDECCTTDNIDLGIECPCESKLD